MFKKRIIKILVGIVFFLFAILTLYWQDYKTSGNFFILKENISPMIVQGASHKKIIKNSPLSVTFIADENNLGSLGVRFNNYGRVSSDRILFKVKYHNALYYQHTYFAKEFSGLKIFPFGFMLITSSKGQLIRFELISLSGNSSNAVSLDDQKPNIIANYNFSRTYLLHNKMDIFSFLLKKLLYIVTDMQNYPLIIFLFSPFLLYILSIFFLKENISSIWQYLFIEISKKINKVKKYIDRQSKTQNSKKASVAKTFFVFAYMLLRMSLFFFVIAILAIFFDSFYNIEYSQIYIPIIILLWIGMFYIHTLDYRISFGVAAFLLILCILFPNFHDGVTVKKLSFWAYLFIWFGLIHTSILLMRKKLL